MIVYGIKNCDTVRKARRFLDEHDIAYRFHDLRADGITSANIHDWLRHVDWQQLLNKRGQTWRQLDDADKNTLDESQAITLMSEHPMLIKRPVICDDNGCVVGFDEALYKDRYVR